MFHENAAFVYIIVPFFFPGCNAAYTSARLLTVNKFLLRNLSTEFFFFFHPNYLQPDIPGCVINFISFAHVSINLLKQEKCNFLQR